MSNRRRSQRFTLLQPVTGTLEVARPVVVYRNSASELFAVSPVPMPAGEVLTLRSTHPEGSESQKVRVSESRPIVFEGALRHYLTLTAVETDGRDGGERESRTSHEG